MYSGSPSGLPQPWEEAIGGWLTWLRISGTSVNTQRLRRDHVQMVARRTNLHHPRELTLTLLVELFSRHNWSLDHRKSLRSSLISFGDWCVGNGYIDSNPAEQLPRMPGDKPRPRPCPDDVWRELLANAAPRERMMARLAGEAGLRRAEVAQVRRDDLVRDRGGWALIVHGKGSKQRVVPITERLAADIMAYCQHGYLFPGQTNGHISPKWAGQVISSLMPPGITMHKLRTRYATRGYAGTRNLRAVQEALGHASVATTQLYTLTSDDEVRAVSEAAGDDDTGPLPVA